MSSWRNVEAIEAILESSDCRIEIDTDLGFLMTSQSGYGWISMCPCEDLQSEVTGVRMRESSVPSGLTRLEKSCAFGSRQDALMEEPYWSLCSPAECFFLM